MKNQLATLISLLSIAGAIVLGFFLFEVALLNILIFWTIVLGLSLLTWYLHVINNSNEDVVRIEGKHVFAIVSMVGLLASTVAVITAYTVESLT